jgi:arsenate reductase (thioredoxin)
MVPPRRVDGIRGPRPRLRGDITPRPTPSPAAAIWGGAAQKVEGPPPLPVEKKRVLFVCVGNSCRSQMAEAFARAYGSDTLWVQSAGLSPATMVAPLTRQILAEKGLPPEEIFPKGLEFLSRIKFDLVVNMSGRPFPYPAEMVNWNVKDPIGMSAETYRTVADQIESLVMRLILETRVARQKER